MLSEIHNQHGERIDHTFTPGAEGCRSVVVIGHGVTANKDRPWLVALSTALGAAGIPTLRISFCGNGDSDGRFEDATISKEVADLGAVLDAVTQDRPKDRIAYVGHSMGGAVGVLRAAEDDRIGFLVSLAGMVHTGDFVRRKFGDLEPGRDCMWEKPDCPLSQAFVDDLESIDTVIPSAARIQVPWLLVHGGADEVVLQGDSTDACAAAGDRPSVVLLEGVDHVFSDDAAELMAGHVSRWLAEKLSSA